MRFPEILKSLRKSQGLSQAELAKQIGFTQQAIARWEMGKNLPDLDTLSKLADIFDVSTDYMIGRGDILQLNPKSDPHWGWNAVLSKEDAEFLVQFRHLNLRGRQKVLAYILDLSFIPQYTEDTIIDHGTTKKND